MAEQATDRVRLAGLVLAGLGVLTYGGTSAFGLVLCVEWLCDPNRARRLRLWDWVGLVLAVPGAAFFILFSIGLFDYAPGGTIGPIPVYWVGFGVWLLVRSRTRWRGLRESRGRGPGHPTVAADDGA